MLNFESYIEKRNLIETNSPEAQEAMRDIQIIINKTLDVTRKINGYGITDIKFSFINEEKANGGIQINMEAKGTAHALNSEHVNRLLQKLMLAAREPLWKHKIFLECHYHQIDVSENAYEGKDIDTRQQFHFMCICAAIVFTEPMA